MNTNDLNEQGYIEIPGFASPTMVAHLKQALDKYIKGTTQAGIRSIANKVPEILELANSFPVHQCVEQILGNSARLVRSMVFNKTVNANWLVTWHQDVSIAVAAKVTIPGFRSWSMKEGVCHVQPPVHILENMVTFRLHLDGTDVANGALIVSPGTHKLGHIHSSEVRIVANERAPHMCIAKPGDALMFRPLLAHCSKKATSPGARRIVHLEYCSAALPAPLQWASTE